MNRPPWLEDPDPLVAALEKAKLRRQTRAALKRRRDAGLRVRQAKKLRTPASRKETAS